MILTKVKPVWKNQIKISFLPLLALYVPILVILVLVSLQDRVSVPRLFSDPATLADMPFYTGFFSNVGVLFWCATAAISLFTFAVLQADTRAGEWPLFFLGAGLVTTMLLLDDMFLIHEGVLLRYWKISETLTFAVYWLIILLYLARFRKTILSSEFLPLILALGFFGMSVIVDLEEITDMARSPHMLIEDGFKLLGIASWAFYFIKTGLDRLKKRPHFQR